MVRKNGKEERDERMGVDGIGGRQRVEGRKIGWREKRIGGGDWKVNREEKEQWMWMCLSGGGVWEGGGG